MRFYFPTLALIGASIFVCSSVSATSIVPFTNLGEATLYSESVVLARAVTTISIFENGQIYQDTRFESLESTKGILLPGTVFNLRPYSRTKGKYKINIAGDFNPEIGKTYLLFLNQGTDFWRPVMLSYYVFEQFQDGDDAFLIPVGGHEIETLTRPDGLAVEALGVYQKNALLQQLQAIGGAEPKVWDGNFGRSSLHADDFKALNRVGPNGCDFTLGGPNLSRWQDAAIPIYFDDTSNPAGWGSIFGNVISALSSNYTGIDPSNAGSKSFTPDCVGGSAVGGNFTDYCDSDLNGPQSALIMFEDPCNEIPNLNNCAGTLAFGGSYSSSDTHQFDNLPWDNALYGFVVVNNAVPGCLSDANYEKMLTHELTHVYRMGHLNPSNFPNQNMNPSCCNAINTKDQECMNYAYPAPAPVELISFEAQIEGETQVKLQWITQSENENAFFTILRSGNGIHYDVIQQVQSSGNNHGGNYQYMDSHPLSGINYYLLSQTDLDGKVQHLGIKAVTLGSTDAITIQPNPVQTNLLVFSLELQGYFEGTLEILNTDGQKIVTQALSMEKGNQTMQQPFGSIPSGVYLLQLSDDHQKWLTRFVKQ